MNTLPVNSINKFKHWTPGYIGARLNQMIYEKLHPDLPWLTRDAIDRLASLIRKEHVGLEFGSGRSTAWFADRCRFLTSVEHNRVWYQKVSGQLRQQHLNNVEYLLLEEDADAGDETTSSDYVKVICRFPEQSLDFVLVDGIYRANCACESVTRVRPGGILILDNANWYVPCQTRSPASRSLADGPLTPQWERFMEMVKDWKCVWTSNSVTDTAIYLKPDPS